MAKEEILTLQQKRFLELASEEKYVREEFYLSGGTALSAFYMFHRYSEDLDFFIEKEEVNLELIKRFIGKAEKKLNLLKVDYRGVFGIHNFFLYLPSNEILKVDFSYYPFPRIEKGLKYSCIAVDSLYDIAVNKVHTISMQPRARDFIDIFFIIKEKKYTMQDLLKQARIKFDWHIDPLQLGIQLLKAKEVKDYPRMIKKIAPKEWQDFFIAEAKKLGKKIF